MLRTRTDQPTLWDAILPEELLALPPLLAKVDQLLDDETFFAPFREHFHPLLGRPSIPMETYLRMMLSLSTAISWATRRCAAKSPTRSTGCGAAASRWERRYRTPPR